MNELRARVTGDANAEQLFQNPDLFKGTNNMALSWTDATYVREQLRRIDEAIAQTDGVLVELSEMLDSYTRRREIQVETRRSCAALLSPLRDFPIELLGHIFMFACEESRQMRWTISHVCQWWRHAAIAMSELWAEALMPLTFFTSGVNEAKAREYVETCILRSNSRRMTWECWEDQWYEISDHADLMSPVLRTTPCKELTWTSLGRGNDTILDVLHHVLPDIITSSSEALQSLTMRTTDPEEYWWRVGLPPDLIPLPLEKFTRLSKLHLSTLHPVPRGSLNVLWANVTDLSIKTPLTSYPFIQDILTNCRSLQYCVFGIPRFDNIPWDVHRGSFFLQQLHKLHLNSLSPEFFYRILDTLQAPSLTDLIVESKRFSDFGPMPLQKFLLHCSSTLRRLWIAPIFGHEIRGIIAATVPLLEELGIMLHGDHTSNPLKDLEVDIYTEPLLPHLRSLTVVSLPSSEVYSRFMTIVQNRGLWPIRTLPTWRTADLPRLRYMRLYQHDPDWNYQDLDLEAEREWREVSSDFDVRFARVEQEFKAAFLTSPEWPITKDET